MLRALFQFRLRNHARRIHQFIFPQGYAGDYFLCGGAFKPLLRKGLPINDFDLWVRNRKEREKLCEALLQRGATLMHDFHPFCMKFRLEGRIIEITYHNVKDGSLADIINTFDLALCGMGTRFADNRVAEICVSDACWRTIQHRELFVLESYFCLLIMQRTPSLLRTLHRMGQAAAELGYNVHAESERRLWDLFWNTYSEKERQQTRDFYFDTMVSYKGQQNDRLMQRAAHSYFPLPHDAEGDPTPLQIMPKAA